MILYLYPIYIIIFTKRNQNIDVYLKKEEHHRHAFINIKNSIPDLNLINRLEYK